MQCCTSTRKSKSSTAADPADPPIPSPLPVAPVEETVILEHLSDRNRETVKLVSSTNNYSSVPLSNRSYDEEPESTADVEAAFLAVTNLLTATIGSKERLLRALYVSGRHPSKRQINLLWKDFADENGISFKSFTEICKEEKLPTRSDLFRAFEHIDKNHTGYINLHELEAMLTTRGEKMSREEFKRLTMLLNISSDGTVRYGDFCENIAMITHECREVTRQNRIHRLRDPVPDIRSSALVTATLRPHVAVSKEFSQRSASKEREISEQQLALQQQLNKRYSDSLFCKLLDPAHAVRPKIPKLDTWNELDIKGYFVLDDPSKGGFVTSTYSLLVKHESRIYATIDVTKSHRLSERLQKLDIGLYIVNQPSEGGIGQIHLSEFGFGEVHGVCVLPPGNYMILPYTTGCILKDHESAAKSKEQKAKSAATAPKLVMANGKLSKDLMDCIEDVFRLFDLDGDGFLDKGEFASYYRNSEDEVSLDATAWNAILERSEAEGQKLSFSNFVRLFELELDDADEDGLEDIVIGLNNLGISRHLIMEEACGYSLQLFYESSESDVKLFVSNELSSMSGPIREAIVAETVSEGIELPCRRLADVGAAAYAFTDDRHVKIAVRYKAQTKTRIQLRLDASESTACIFASASGSLRGKDGNSSGGPRNVLTSTINANTTVPLLFAVPSHPERMAEFIIASIDIIQP